MSRSCRLAIDLPILGVLTWLCAGAKSPRRAIDARDLWRRVRSIFPAWGYTERQEGAALRRLWKAGLATVTAAGKWRPVWHADATVCRIDVAVWTRADLSPAAKRVHALCAHRLGRGDAVEFLAAMVGGSRGRIGEALVELREAGLFVASGVRRGRRGKWTTWSTGTHPEGLPIHHEASFTRRHPGAASPNTRRDGCQNLSGASADRTSDVGAARWRRDVQQAAESRSVRRVFEAAGVGAPMRKLTAKGLAGLDRMRAELADRLTSRGTTAGTVASWLLEHERRGRTPGEACAALLATVGRSRKAGRRGGVELEPFVKRSGAERLLPDGPRKADVRELVRAAAKPEEGGGCLLRMAGECVTRGRRMLTLQRELDNLERLAAALDPITLRKMGSRLADARKFLAAELQTWKPSRTTCTRTVG